jgi:aldehyde:ferredoxin oxidoreductase
VEVLCIGPAGERQFPFANVIHRLSWTGDHLGLGYLFGVKQLKAIAIRGKKPVTLHDPQQFLNLCLVLKDRIRNDRKIKRLTESGTFSLLERGGMMTKGNGPLPRESEKQWAASLKTHFFGQEGCFSCPVHCGVNIEHQDGGYFGGIHLEKAWHLGPQIGVYEGKWTLKLLRLCQTQGLDPFSAGALLARILEGVEKGPHSEEDLRQADGIADRGEKALFILRRLINSPNKEFHFAANRLSENEDLDVLADILSFCLIVVNRLNLMTVSNMIDLIHAATGYALSKEDLRDSIWNILQMESRLQNKRPYPADESSLGRLSEGQISEILRKEKHPDEPITHRTAS